MSIISIPDASHRSYTLQTSEDVGSRTVRVRGLEKGGRRYLKTRELVQDEIVSFIIDEDTTEYLWTIHRPIRGWYIHLRRFDTTTLASASTPTPPISLFPARSRPTTLTFSLPLSPFSHVHFRTITSSDDTSNNNATLIPNTLLTTPKISPKASLSPSPTSNSSPSSLSAATATGGRAVQRSPSPTYGHSKSLSLSATPLSPNSPTHRHVSSSQTNVTTSTTIFPASAPPTPHNSHTPALTTAAAAARIPMPISMRKEKMSFTLAPEEVEEVEEDYKTFNPLRMVRYLWGRQKEKGLSFGLECSGRIVGRFEDRPKFFSTATEGTLFLDIPSLAPYTPTDTTSSTTGGMDDREKDEEAFWIAVAVAYIEFLEDRDAYHAASEG